MTKGEHKHSVEYDRTWSRRGKKENICWTTGEWQLIFDKCFARQMLIRLQCTFWTRMISNERWLKGDENGIECWITVNYLLIFFYFPLLQLLFIVKCNFISWHSPKTLLTNDDIRMKTKVKFISRFWIWMIDVNSKRQMNQ